MSIKIHWAAWTYRFKHWCFWWFQDDSGDIGIRIAGVLYLTKYKEHTMISWFKIKHPVTSAPKYIN